MAMNVAVSGRPPEDPVSNVLKWILLAVAVVSFALFAWATVLTYERAPPQPERFVTAGGAMLMTAEDIVAGKAGFQKADLMDYGSLYGMGSYYGQDYTASALMRLADADRGQPRPERGSASRSTHCRPSSRRRSATRCASSLQRVDLTRQRSRACPTPWRAPSPRCATEIGEEPRHGRPRHRLDAGLQPRTGRARCRPPTS